MNATPDAWSLAYGRFGYGPRSSGASRTGDPREALLAEIAPRDAARINTSGLKPTNEIIAEIQAFNDRRNRDREAAAIAQLAAKAMPEPGVAALLFPAAESGAPAMAPSMTPEQPPHQIAFRDDAKARLARAYEAPIGFVERWVAFWSNHFCVSVAKSEIGRGAAGAYEREAIRPHALGRFADMLKAVEQHPAMLNFLDNAQSIGPNSIAGHNNKTGLNENLAREILELHTMGVGSGYTQNDVTQLANILTGWTIAGRDGKLGAPGTFVFNPKAHEPLAAVVRERLYLQEGVAQGEAALADLAREDATATHIARKLARHFIADAPDAGLVNRLARVFSDTDGNLAVLARTLIEDPISWSAPPTKIRNPWELTMAAFRAFNREPTDPGPALNALNLLGMPLWQPAGPNGFAEDNAAWTSPEGMKTRVELATQFARQIKDAPKPLDLMETILGAGVSAPTREAITRAESSEQAYALLILSPEFQRR